MGTIAEKLQRALDNKNAIKAMLLSKGLNPGDNFSDYAGIIGQLPNIKQEKTVTAGTSAITVTPDSDKILCKVTVNPTPSQTKTVTPTKNGVTVTPDSGKLLSSVTISGDADLISSNIRSGKNIFGVNGSMQEGIEVYIDGIKQTESINLTTNYTNLSLSALPINFYSGSLVIYNNEIHILGGASQPTAHYKWDGTTWSSVSTLPFDFYDGAADVLNNEIYIVGGSDGPTIYKWNGSAWTYITTLYYPTYDHITITYQNKLHILGSSQTNAMLQHRTYDGTNWTYTNLPSDISTVANASAVVYNNEIHILGCRHNHIMHYKYDGTTWTEVGTMPYEFQNGCAVVYNNEIHIIGHYDLTTPGVEHYKWNGSEWTSVQELAFSFEEGCACVYNDKIYIFGGENSKTQHTQLLFEYYAKI